MASAMAASDAGQPRSLKILTAMSETCQLTPLTPF
jgi:hypothetical protein